MAESGLLLQEIAGMDFRPVAREWVLSGDLSMNYIAMARKVGGEGAGAGAGEGAR